MKKVLLALVLCVAGSAMSSSAFAFPNADEMQANFKTCNESDSSWNRRWGQYVVTFERNDATRICNEMYSGHGRTGLAACSANGAWLYAGYVCYEVDGGHQR